MNVLMWFRQDLRIHDHAALTLAAGLGAVVPVYIFDPEQWARSDTSARQFQFIAEAVEDLRADLASLGAALLIRTGPVAQVLARLCARHAITTIVTQGSAPRALTAGATHFHTTAVNPDWSRRFAKTASIGSHLFYRMR